MLGTTAVRGDCSSLSFRALLAAQFIGALNDNLFKLFVTLLIVRDVLQQAGGITHLVLINVCFIAPYILFSTVAGGLADKLSKTVILRGAKLFELVIMLSASFFLARESSYALLGVLFFMGVQSTIFSPSKYGILPELLDEPSLSRGNGYLEFCTFIGIIFGTAFAGVVLSFFDFATGVPGRLLVMFSGIGCALTFCIGKTKPAAPLTVIEANPLNMFHAAVAMRAQTGLFLSVLAISYFWAIGALYQLNLVLFGRIEAGLGDLAVSLQLAALGTGIGVGSIVAGKVSEGKVELGLVPLGAMGLAFWSIVLYFLPAYPLPAGFSLLAVGFSAGFYIVPLNSYLQQNSPDETRGNCLAACNFVSFSGMLFFSVLLLVGIDLVGLQPSGIFLLSGISAVFVAVYICSVLPEVLLRCINWLLMHLLYRIEIKGEENVPKEGGALLVCNHVSMVDASLLLASLTRVVRFLMFRPYYENKLVHPFAKALGTIPIEGGRGTTTANALEGASAAIAGGDLVGIFAEGAITRTGQMLRFRTGLERIMDSVDAPIIPVHLDQVWGSVFSFRNGRFFWKIPRKIPYPVGVTFGKPLAATARASEVRQAVQELSVEAYSKRSTANMTLAEAFIKVAKNNGMRTAILTPGKRYSYYRLLANALALSKVLRQRFANETIYCIAGDSGALSGPKAVMLNLAVLCNSGKVVPLDSSVTEPALLKVQNHFSLSYCLQADDDSVCPPSLTKVSFDELWASVRFLDSLWSFVQVLFVPSFFLQRFLLPKVDAQSETAAVLFSRGRTSDQKAVELTHQNIVSNCSAFQELFTFHNDDIVSGALPFSHAMGYTATLWLPLLSGCRVAYPESCVSGKLQLRFLFMTANQLEQAIGEADADRRFNSVSYVLVGGDAIAAEVREEFHQRFSCQLLEGYGSVELAPLALLNVPDFEQGPNPQKGQKPGMLGHPLPGVAVKVMSKDSAQRCAAGEIGELWVKGPNVMKGYVGAGSDQGSELRDGWLQTGDLVVIDDDGFVEFRGRS